MSSDRPVREAENRLEKFNADRERLLSEVERRVVARKVSEAQRGGDDSLEYVLNDVAYCEIKRLDHKNGAADRWKDLSRRLLGMNGDEKREELRKLVRHYGQDVVGNFDPRVYKFATGIGPSLLGFVFNPMTSLREGMTTLRNLDARIHADGDLDVVRGCAERGTIVVVPTHSSNMDSPAIGLGMLRAHLPPVTYGAGKNLFSNPFVSFFMRNLGAYRVDRRLRFELYKDVLKEYSTVLLEHGYHSLFFPGGTRNRSNIIEKHLKLGLLGTTVTAYKNSVREGAPNKRIYIVPATINYRLVLEAETLIEDYLAETGKRRFIITDDEFSRVGRIVEFFRKILVHEGSVVVRFGRPLDPFGNDITDDGESIDRAGRIVDPASFVRGADGEVADDDQRDAEYTRALGRRLSQVYPRLTVLHSTNLASRAVFEAICKNAATRDIYRLMRAPLGHLEVPVPAAIEELVRLRARLAQHPEWGSEHPSYTTQSADAKLDDAIRGLSSYHTVPVIERRGETLQVKDVKLLFYYQNRTAHIPPDA
ncbi:MAG: 1-acyl-sn-glycerol-3-phosphate acyltransferase [Deltaproteobacteria bacterium]|nr:1-acyl-sn-glycerol-3-phosphate acyltransferase [Deltaproteobacteria bacterium]MDQ3299935.1 1-acyl-sn-glycerol-3-phosphate acyltransferase [Myxococcota bacterium]